MIVFSFFPLLIKSKSSVLVSDFIVVFLFLAVTSGMNNEQKDVTDIMCMDLHDRDNAGTSFAIDTPERNPASTEEISGMDAIVASSSSHDNHNHACVDEYEQGSLLGADSLVVRDSLAEISAENKLLVEVRFGFNYIQFLSIYKIFIVCVLLTCQTSCIDLVKFHVPHAFVLTIACIWNFLRKHQLMRSLILLIFNFFFNEPYCVIFIIILLYDFFPEESSRSDFWWWRWKLDVIQIPFNSFLRSWRE